jgi:hypothetical protein
MHKLDVNDERTTIDQRRAAGSGSCISSSAGHAPVAFRANRPTTAPHDFLPDLVGGIVRTLGAAARGPGGILSVLKFFLFLRHGRPG